MLKTLAENHKINWKRHKKKKNQHLHIITPKKTSKLPDTHLIFVYVVEVVVYPSLKFLKQLQISIILKVLVHMN